MTSHSVIWNPGSIQLLHCLTQDILLCELTSLSYIPPCIHITEKKDGRQRTFTTWMGLSLKLNQRYEPNPVTYLYISLDKTMSQGKLVNVMFRTCTIPHHVKLELIWSIKRGRTDDTGDQQYVASEMLSSCYIRLLANHFYTLCASQYVA